MKFITLSDIRFNIDHIVAYKTIKNAKAKKCWASYVHTVDGNKFLVNERVEEIDEMIRNTFKH